MKQVQAVTGHKSEEMTGRYTHFNPLDFGKVPKIQEDLLREEPENGDTADAERPALTIVNLQKELSSEKRKHAS